MTPQDYMMAETDIERVDIGLAIKDSFIIDYDILIEEYYYLKRKALSK